MNDNATTFQQHQPKLYGLAYRMLGSTADAEDIVQDAFLRWHQTEAGRVQVPEAWLTTIVTRLCIDRLRAARTERAAYSGPWLPEPVVGEGALPVVHDPEFAPDLSVAFLVVLERLTPEARAAFLLHEVFDCDYPEIASVLGRNEATCRQIVRRARVSVHGDRPRLQVSAAVRTRLLEKFVSALRARDHDSLLALFAEDVTWTADGGGKVTAARKVVNGAQRVALFATKIWQRYLSQQTPHWVRVNGEPGLVMCLAGAPTSALSIDTDGERILAFYNVVNPDKLKRVVLSPPH